MLFLTPHCGYLSASQSTNLVKGTEGLPLLLKAAEPPDKDTPHLQQHFSTQQQSMERRATAADGTTQHRKSTTSKTFFYFSISSGFCHHGIALRTPRVLMLTGEGRQLHLDSNNNNNNNQYAGTRNTRTIKLNRG